MGLNHGDKVYFDEIDCCSSWQADRIIELLEMILIKLNGEPNPPIGKEPQG